MTTRIVSRLLLAFLFFGTQLLPAQQDFSGRGAGGPAGMTGSSDPRGGRQAGDSGTGTAAADGTFAGRGAAALGVVAGNYILNPMDVIKVDVFQEPDLAKEIRLSADGTISMPLIGELNLKGMSVDDAQKMIQNAYKGDYLINPHVTILVLSYTQRFIYVHGHVGRPGPVPIPPEQEMTLSEAINTAGGLTRMARRGDITIRRLKEGGSTEVIEVDFDDIMESPEVSDIKLQDGDHVIVHERYI